MSKTNDWTKMGYVARTKDKTINGKTVKGECLLIAIGNEKEPKQYGIVNLKDLYKYVLNNETKGFVPILHKEN